MSALLIAFSCVAVMMVTKERRALRKLARLDWLLAWAAVALELQNFNMAQTTCAELLALYRRRSKVHWVNTRFSEQILDIFLMWKG